MINFDGDGDETVRVNRPLTGTIYRMSETIVSKLIVFFKTKRYFTEQRQVQLQKTHVLKGCSHGAITTAIYSSQ